MRTSMMHTVLVVEDTPDARQFMRLALEIEGYRVLEAADGWEAVETARRERPDAIVMDMSLPVRDGYWAAKRIREEPEMATVPIIACTAHNRWEWRGKAIAAGCTEFMTKPLDPRELVAAVTRHVRRATA
jgi:two-component system, cell cycle response regulator DivK